MDIFRRADDDDEVFTYVSPWAELNAGLWSLFAGATVFLALRVYCKLKRQHGLWYDDYILIVSWAILMANNALIVYEFATGYILADSTQTWDYRMHVLINISSCGTPIGQALTKTAFGVTLLRLCKHWQRWIIWFCIVTMNTWMIMKVMFQWAKVCNNSAYQDSWRLNFCIGADFRDDFKEGGNVYNIIMDFIFAFFPWLITRPLEMRRAEKISLCATMSLGIIVAIIAAVRVSWKDDGNVRDPYYIWRNGLSQVWYSSEITGTIMVQCIPILRPIVREIHSPRRISTTITGNSYSGGNECSSKRKSFSSDNESLLTVISNMGRSKQSNLPKEKVGIWKALTPLPSTSIFAGWGAKRAALDSEEDMRPLAGKLITTSRALEFRSMQEVADIEQLGGLHPSSRGDTELLSGTRLSSPLCRPPEVHEVPQRSSR